MAVSTTKITPANPRPARPASCSGAATLADPDTAKSALTKSEHHYQLLKGVATLEIADMATNPKSETRNQKNFKCGWR